MGKDQNALALLRAPLRRGSGLEDVPEAVTARRAIEVEAKVAERLRYWAELRKKRDKDAG